MPSRAQIPTAIAFLLLLGCNSSEPDEEEGTGAGPSATVSQSSESSAGVGGEGGSHGTASLGEVRAPTRTTVRLDVSDTTDPSFADAASYSVVDELGGVLSVTGAAAEAGVVTLTTAPQRLGLSYSLTFAGTPLDGETATFLGADTAELFTLDFGSGQVSEKTIATRRDVIGESAVVYVEEGVEVEGIAEAVEEFDTLIAPVEHGLFTDPPDEDQNGKLVIVVVDGGSVFAGYFNPFNAMTNQQAMIYGLHSNEMEIVYMNGSFGHFQSGTLAHEYQHLLFDKVHGPQGAEWQYHNEGLSECAEHAVYGEATGGIPALSSDPSGTVADGISLVHWDATYEHYGLAYLYWTYIASRLEGVATYGDLFQLDGDPASIDSFLQGALGESFNEVLRDTWIAMRVQAPEGPLGFGDMIEWNGATIPVSSNPSLALEPFGAVFLAPPGESIEAPLGAGPDISFVGINGAHALDMESPFDISGGGVLLAINMSTDTNSAATEPIGFDPISPARPTARKALPSRDPAWMHPPPPYPYDGFAALRAWRERTRPGNP